MIRANAIVLVCVGLVLANCTDPSPSDDLGGEPDLVDPVEGLCTSGPAGRADPFADCVEAFDAAPGVSFGHEQMPEIVLGAPQGGGETMGGTHVASLGCGGSITLHWSEPWPTDGPGPDFAVFENAFVAGSTTFVEPAQVFVSADGVDWYAFDCEPGMDDDNLEGCAGIRPVLAADESNDPSSAGGDLFDLEEVGLSEARYVRIVDRTAEHYGSETWCQGASGGFDLDAVGLLEAGR